MRERHGRAAMDLDDQRESSNVDDERGASGSGGGGGFGGLPFRVGGIGAVVIIVGGLLLGVSPQTILALLSGGSAPSQTSAPTSQASPGLAPQGQPASGSAEDPQRRFVGQILGSTEDVWTQQFQAMGRTYHDPKLVLYSGQYPSACGTADTATGPFYCPGDQRVYLDLGFFTELQDKLGAGGEFARAYVIAHEVGHHVQDELGLMSKVAQQRDSLDQTGRNALSVKVELQADCYAGIWANHANAQSHILQAGDIESGINAAAAVGDDRLQRAATGTVSPDSFTHGTSAQRSGWFKRGYQNGALADCDTFSGND
jgi:predicted metalloprotease